MTQLLIKALEAAVAGPAEKKAMQAKIVAHDIPMIERQLGQSYVVEGENGKHIRARELLLSEAIESTTLIQTEIYRTIIEGSEPAKCMREAVPIFRMNSNVMQINSGEAGAYASFIAEGAEVPIDTQDYSSRTWTAKKFGSRPLITQEMVDDSLFGVIELEVRKAGYRVENTLNQWMVACLLDNAGNEYDINAAVAALGGAAAIREAMALNATDGYTSDTVIIHPQVLTYIYKDYVPIAYNPVAQQNMATGVLPNILGCKLFQCGASVTTTSTPTASTYVWGAPTDSYIGMLVIDAKNCGGIGMRQDTKVEQYRDPVRDLVGINVTMRAACQYGSANAIARVEYGGA